MKPNKIIAITTALLTLLIAAGGFTLSYAALKQVALDNGISETLSYVWPLLIDASMIVFSLSVVNAYLNSEGSVKQWSLVAIYTLATIGFNILHAPDTIQAQIVATIAPVSLFFSFEMLMSQLKNSVKRIELTQNIQELSNQLDTVNSKISEANNQLDIVNSTIDSRTIELSETISVKQSELDGIIADRQSMLTELNTRISRLQTINSEIISGNNRVERLDKLLTYLADNPGASIVEANNHSDVSYQTTIKDIRELEESGLLVKNGNGWERV